MSTLGPGGLPRKATSVLLLIMLLGGLTSIHLIQKANSEPATWTVDADGSEDFQTIQEAINAAREGDRINVTGGVYNEHVTVDRAVSLTGENASTTIIDGGGSGTVVLVMADNVTLEGFTVRNGRSGIVVSLCRNCRIESNLVEDNSYQGIFVNKAQNCTVSGNHAVRTGGYGINVNASQSILVEENGASSSYYDGIGLRSSRNCTIRGNAVNNNSLYGIWLDSSYNNLLYHNNLFGNDRHVSSNSPSNTWDNGLEGNYWSNYTGTDADGDGVGDEVFVVDDWTLQRDRFPLMRPHINDAYLSVDTEPPVASFTCSPEAPLVNMTVRFDASESYDSAGKNTIASYNWDFGDGTTGTGMLANHTYLAPRNASVSLTVTDVVGNMGHATAELLVELEEAEEVVLDPSLVIGILTLGGVVGTAILIFWHRSKKKPQ